MDLNSIFSVIAMVIGYIVTIVTLLFYLLLKLFRKKEKSTEDDRRNRAWLGYYQEKISFEEFYTNSILCKNCKTFHIKGDTCRENY